MTAALSLAGVGETEGNATLMAICLHELGQESVSGKSMGALRQLQTASGASSDVRDYPDLCSCGHAEGGPGQAYNEEAFRYFLAVERRRFEMSNRPFMLLLVDLKKQREMSPHIPQAMATRLFAGLSQCLRETDFVGWYRENRVAGAVLTERPHTTHTDVSQDVAQRVRQALNEQFESDVSGRLQISIYQIPPMQDSEIAVREGEI